MRHTDTDETRTIVIDSEGQVRFLYSGELESLCEVGTATKRRASHVEPHRLSLRLAFHALRIAFGEDTIVGNWTRRWTCIWRVDMRPSGGEIFGHFFDRGQAIRAEEQWLSTRL